MMTQEQAEKRLAELCELRTADVAAHPERMDMYSGACMELMNILDGGQNPWTKNL